MAIEMDFSQASEGMSVQDGTYEVVISSVDFDSTKNGKENINFDMVIRNDVPQKYQNAHIFNKLWPKKDTSDYSMPYLFMIAKNAGMEDHKHYPELVDMLHDYYGHGIKVTVKNEESEYNGKTYNNLNVKKWEPSDFPQVAHKWKKAAQAASTTQSNVADPFANNGQPIDISDDDLPF